MDYTPTPWRAVYLNEGGPVKSPGWEITTPNYDVAAWIERGAPIRNESDAKLMAAAPEMYEVLKDLIIDDPTYGVMVSTNTEATSRAAELLRRLED